jgi:hypothetical protein
MGDACGLEVSHRHGARQVLGQQRDEDRPGVLRARRRSGGRGRRRWAGCGAGRPSNSDAPRVQEVVADEVILVETSDAAFFDG